MMMNSFLKDEIDSLSPENKTGASRRGFIQGSIAAGFAAAVAPTGDLLAQVITTDSQGLTAGFVEIPGKDRSIPAYRAMPSGKTKLGCVIVVHEIFGVHEYIQDVCRRFAKLGYMAVAPNFFVRQGDVTQYKTVPEIFSNVVSKASDAQVLADVDAALTWAAANGADSAKVGITGFCWGGRIVWMASAANPKLKAVVARHHRPRSSSFTPKPLMPFMRITVRVIAKRQRMMGLSGQSPGLRNTGWLDVKTTTSRVSIGD